jgi:hypothetical protein
MHDMGRSHQLRTPFWDGKKSFLYHTPQSGIKIHQEVGSVILPVVAIPSSTPGKQIIRFLDPNSINQIDQLNLDPNSKEYHGRISTEINKILAPYIMGYAHRWEEILNFANGRAGDEIHFEAKILLGEFVEKLQKKCNSIISTSYEPDRNDAALLQEITQIFENIQSTVLDSTRIVRSHKIKINLTGYTGKMAIRKILLIIKRVLIELNESKAAHFSLGLFN